MTPRTLTQECGKYTPAGWKLNTCQSFMTPPPQTNDGSHASSGTHTSNDNATDSADDFILSPTSKTSRGTRHGRDVEKVKEVKDRSKQQRHDTREKQFEEIMKSLASVSSEMHTKMRISAITETLKVATDDEVKKKLEAK